MHMQEQFGHVTVTYDEETALLQQPRPEDLLVEQLLEEIFASTGADGGQLTGGLAKKAEKVICLEESVSRCRLLAKRWQTVDNIGR